MPSPRIPILVLTAALAVGCGSSSGGGRLTKAEFTKRADAICATANRQEKALRVTNTLPGLERAVTQEEKVIGSALNRLTALKPPAGQQTAYARYLAGVRRERALADQVLAALKQQDITKVASLSHQASALSTQAHAQAESLGLAGCAVSTQTTG